MDPTEDLSARVLLKHILTTEPPRTPITRSTSKAQGTSATRRSSRPPGNKDAGAKTPQDILRRSLRHKLRESITRKSLHITKRRTASFVLKKTNTPAPDSMLFDDGDTPRHILMNILQTEPVRTPVVHEKTVSEEPQPSAVDSSITSKHQSIELSGLDLPDITIGNAATATKGLSRKRPRRSLNVTAFEKRLKDGEDVEEENVESEVDHSSLSLSSSTSLSLKTPFVDARSEKRGLQRRVSNRRKITEEEFAAAVIKRQMGGWSDDTSIAHMTMDLQSSLETGGHESSVPHIGIPDGAEPDADKENSFYLTVEESRQQSDNSPEHCPQQLDDEIEQLSDKSLEHGPQQLDGESDQLSDNSPERGPQQLDGESGQQSDNSPEHSPQQLDEDSGQQSDNSPEHSPQQLDEDSGQQSDNSPEHSPQQLDGESEQLSDNSPEHCPQQLDEESEQLSDNSPEHCPQQLDEESEQLSDNSPVRGPQQLDEESEQQSDNSPERGPQQLDEDSEQLSDNSPEHRPQQLDEESEQLSDNSPERGPQQLDEDCGQLSDNSPEQAAAPDAAEQEQEEEWEDDENGEESEEVPSKTPAFVKEKRRIFHPDPLASPSVLRNVQASSTSEGLPPPKPKQVRKRTKTAKKERGLPKSYLMSVFKHFAKTKVSADVYPVLEETMDKFFERLADDLETYAVHAKRKTVEIEDAQLLLKRQGYVNDKVPVEVLIEKYLRMDQRKLLIPIATSGNVVIPKQRR